jgi:hypothetical protein
MKVKDLITKLQALNAESDVICICDDDEFLSPGKLFQLFEIDDISSMDATKTRLDDNTPYLKLGKGDLSELHALIGITSNV